MTLLILFAGLSIAVSFVCSILEAVLLSMTPSYIASQRDLNPALHHRLNVWKGNIERPLAAILTLNTIAHTVGATGVGAQVTVLWGEAWLGAASALMTLLILVLSEIIPKTVGASYWRQLVPLIAPLLTWLIWLLRPFIWLSDLITRGIGNEVAEVDMRSEIMALAQIGLEEEALTRTEKRVVTNMLGLHNIRIKDIMTPRTVSVVVKREMTVGEFDADVGQAAFTRFPVMSDTEQAQGYIHKADTYAAESDVLLETLMRPVQAVQTEDSAADLLALMLGDRHHLTVVYDDMGTWAGLVTMEDVFESILGQDIVDETDRVKNMRRYAMQRWPQRLKKLAAQSEVEKPDVEKP